jgi:hypothetical protein
VVVARFTTRTTHKLAALAVEALSLLARMAQAAKVLLAGRVKALMGRHTLLAAAAVRQRQEPLVQVLAAATVVTVCRPQSAEP